MTAALGIGRFVYTPILPAMLGALGWSKSDAGLIASANFLGYLVGALLAGLPLVMRRPRLWLLTALAISAVSTAAMALPSDIASFAALRFIGGIASAFVIVCASTLVLERLSSSGRASLSAIHFAGVGFGIVISAAAVSVMLATGAGWRSLWIGSGLISILGTVVAAMLIPAASDVAISSKPVASRGGRSGIGPMAVAYGLFGFGYVITSTFLVAIVRLTEEVRVLEPWIWILFGLAAIPSVTIWARLGERIGAMNAFAVACIVEAVGVAASVEWVTITGVCFSALLLGGTFMGLTALGFIAARDTVRRKSPSGFRPHDREFRHWSDGGADAGRLPFRAAWGFSRGVPDRGRSACCRSGTRCPDVVGRGRRCRRRLQAFTSPRTALDRGGRTARR